VDKQVIVNKIRLGECKEIISNSLVSFFQVIELEKYFSPHNYRSLCGRYLVKKSILGCFKSSNYLDIGILNNDKGKPEIFFQGELKKEMKESGVKEVVCSISHSRNWVVSMVVIEV
jgi:phosphopantetheinyl transferase (holo-ACP synthase)